MFTTCSGIISKLAQNFKAKAIINRKPSYSIFGVDIRYSRDMLKHDLVYDSKQDRFVTLCFHDEVQI